MQINSLVNSPETFPVTLEFPVYHYNKIIENNTKIPSKDITAIKLTTLGLAKLLYYPDFLKAESVRTKIPIYDLVKKEVKRYPYKAKATFKVNYQ